MVSGGAGYAPPTAQECVVMKDWASKKSSFFLERRF